MDNADVLILRKNENRGRRAARLIDGYSGDTDDCLADLTDMLTDLMHSFKPGDPAGIWDQAYRQAQDHYNTERKGIEA